MKIKILSMGRTKSDPTNTMVEDYVGRIKKFLPMNDIVLKPGADKILTDRVKKENFSHIVAMDERGKHFTSVEFSKMMVSLMNSGAKDVGFVIGGAEGLPQEIKQMASKTIALSKMTLPHRFARLFLTEQIYRALCIEKNIPYHK